MVHPSTADPETLVETLIDTEGTPARIHLTDAEATIPVEPYDGRSRLTEEVSLDAFDAVVDFASLEDDGMTFLGMLHLSDKEWHRTGLGAHWQHESAMIDGEQRQVEVWAAREWDDGPDAPFDRPTLSIYVAKTPEGLHRGGGLDRLTVGTVAAVEPLDDLADWPEEREPLTVDPPVAEPIVTLAEVDPLDPTQGLLEAVYVVNKHAKRLADNAANAYASGDGVHARIHSLRKSALYTLKAVALHRIVKHDPTAVDIERHDIDGQPFVCFSVEGWSYHLPLDSIDEELLDRLPDDGPESAELAIDYERSERVAHSDLSLTDALRRLGAVDLSANAFLEQTSVVDEWWTEHSVVWDCLPD